MKQNFYGSQYDKDPSAGSYFDVESLVRSRVMRKWLSQRSGKEVKSVDVGCGVGYFSREMVRLMNDVYDVSVDAHGLDLVCPEGNVFDDVLGKLSFQQIDIDGNKLPYNDAEFDLVTSNHVIEHLFETELFVKELRRVMKTDGLCVLSTPNLSCFMNRILLLLGIQPLSCEVGELSCEFGWPLFREKLTAWQPAGHIRAFTARALKDIVKKYGFRVVGEWRQEKKLNYRAIALILEAQQ